MLKLFYLTNCPYCRQAFRAMEELYEENPSWRSLSIEKIEESREPAIADSYDYYYVPTIFLENEKLYEAHPGESYIECKENLRKVFERVIGDGSL